MLDYQAYVLQQAAFWPLSSSLVMFAVGMLYGLQGFRFARLLMALTCGAAGFVLGGIVAHLVGVPPVAGGTTLAGLLGAVALMNLRVGVTVSSTLTLGLLGNYLAIRMGTLPPVPVVAGGVGAVIGLTLAWGGQRTLPILITTVQGAALMVVGFVGVAAALAPSFAGTFVEWANELSPLVPVLITMLVVVGYSIQANLQQGDIRTGSTASANWRDEPA